MTEYKLANLDYGYDYHTDAWEIYQHGEPLATVDTEEIAALFAAAPGQAERILELEEGNAHLKSVVNSAWEALERAKAKITELEALAVDVNNELRAEQRSHDFTLSNTKARIVELEDKLKDIRDFLLTRPVDCLGLDPEVGYSYRDEVVTVIDLVLKVDDEAEPQ